MKVQKYLCSPYSPKEIDVLQTKPSQTRKKSIHVVFSSNVFSKSKNILAVAVRGKYNAKKLDTRSISRASKIYTIEARKHEK